VLLAALNENGEGQDSLQMIDSTIVCAHQDAAGIQKGAEAQGEGLGRSRSGLSTNIDLRASGLGLPLAVVLTGGKASYVKGYAPVMDEPGSDPKVLLGDKGYDADAIKRTSKREGLSRASHPNTHARSNVPSTSTSSRCGISSSATSRSSNTAAYCPPLRQYRRQLPRFHTRRIGQTMGQPLRQQNLGSEP
jgi:Transposase DDE domain